MPVTQRLLALTLVTACRAAAPVAPEPPIAAAPTPLRPPPAVATVVETPAEPTVRESPVGPDRASHLRKDDILLQLEHELTFAAVGLVDPRLPFGSIPKLTLYRDGTVIADTKTGAMWWNRGEHVAARDLEHVRALGIAKIPDHLDECVRVDSAHEKCVSDASIVHVRHRGKNGKLDDLANYAGLSNKHAPVLEAIYDRIAIIATPPEPTQTRMVMPWIPTNASLFLRFRHDIEETDHATLSTATPWPLAHDIFDRTVREQWIVVALDRAQVLAVVGTTGTTGDPVLFRLGNRAVMAGLVPWMPGEDHREAIAKTKLGR